MKYAKPKQKPASPMSPRELREQRRKDFDKRVVAEKRGRKK